MSNHRMKGADKPRRKRRLCEAQNWRCAHCGRRLEYDTATLDHVFPWAMGGSNRQINLVIACEPCNRSRMKRLFSLPHRDKFEQLRMLFNLVASA